MVQIERSFQRSITLKEGAVCVECENPATVMHHIVPFSIGGLVAISMCDYCHGKVHGFKRLHTSKLIKEGIKKAKKKGVKIGRPKKIDTKKVIELRKKGLSIRAIAKELGCSKSTAHKEINNYKKGKNNAKEQR